MMRHKDDSCNIEFEKDSSNMVIPTNGVLMAILGIAVVPFEKWFKFVIRLFLILSAIAAIFLVIAVAINY